MGKEKYAFCQPVSLYYSVSSPLSATYDQLTVFHDPDYIDFLKKISDIDDEEKYDEDAQLFGLSMYSLPQIKFKIFICWLKIASDFFIAGE